MNGNQLLAGRMENIRASEIRELLKITERPEVISFAGGLPAPELFPMEALAKVASKTILEDGMKALQYSTTEGYAPLREKIACRMNKVCGTCVSKDEILITSGSQQALDFIGKVFIDKGDEVLLESPSYLGAINAFRAYEPTFLEVETDDDGMLPEALEKALQQAKRPKFIYVIPDFQNPTGRTWSLVRRKKLIEMAEKYSVAIVEDNPYGELRFEGDALPTVKSLDRQGLVIYLGTFSKTLCPGMRVGWMAANPIFRDKFTLVKQGADLHSSTISQMQIDRLLDSFDFDAHIQKLREVYRSRRNAIIEAMDACFPSEIRFNRPRGGLFTWVELPLGMNARRLLEKALDRNVAFVPGGSFFPCRVRENVMRINFSNMPEDRIREGIQRLAGAIESLRKAV